jgi:type I restriction enzyme, S subunit
MAGRMRDDEEKRRLPEGWRWVKLGDVCEFIRGVNFDGSLVSPTPKDNYLPILRSGNLSNYLNTDTDLVFVPSEFVSEKQMLRQGDIAICMSSGSASVVGKTAQVKKDFNGSIGAFCGIVRPLSLELADYLAFWFHSPLFLAWRDSQARGGSIQNLRFSQFSGVEIPLPPLPEQQKIASLLTEQLSAVERARTAAQEQLVAAKALPAAFLREVFESEEAQGWERKQLGGVALTVQNGLYKSAEHYGHGQAFLRMYNIRNDAWTLDLSKKALVDVDESEVKSFSLETNNLVISRVNSYELVGKCAVINEEANGWIYENMIIRIRLPESAHPVFISAQINMDTTRDYIKSIAKRAIGQSSINSSDIKSIPLVLPPYDIQKKYADRISMQIGQVEKAVKSITEQLAYINALPAELLRAAFSGEGV